METKTIKTKNMKIMKKYLFLAAALAAMVSCSDNSFVGENGPNGVGDTDGAIAFGSSFKAVTRGDTYGASAADLLGNKFIVAGVKGDGTGTGQSDVFKSYTVDWTSNTAGTTNSNTSDWEYVGKTNYFGLAGAQSVKFWDYSTTAYDFAAYSVGKGNTLTAKTTSDISTSADPAAGVIYATPIDYSNAGSAAYMLRGSRADLAECYITDMITVAKANYNKEVVLNFRSLASKVRMAIYETVPGYSVKDVKFYTTDGSALLETGSADGQLNNNDATLFGTNAFYGGGVYTVTFPTIGSGNIGQSDYNKAHVAISGSTATSTQSFGTLVYTGKEGAEANETVYLQRSSSSPSFAGSSSFYQTVLPNENGNVLEMRVNYTLVSTDGSGETITIHGAKAFVPAVYTRWLPNFAYTYIFKITDNTNGWTSTTDTDPAGLFPITFDAVVLNSEETGQQSTITTVSTPSITTYQKGHRYSASDEYKVPTLPDATTAASNDAIYAQVMNDGTLVTDLNGTNKSYFYKLSETAGKTYASQPTGWPTGYYTDAACLTPASGVFSTSTTYYTKGPWSEANVMDALNIQESETSGTIVGRNGITLTPATAVYTVTQIPGEDNNWITKYNNAGTPTDISAGMVAKLSPAAAGTYAYVYDYTTGTPAATPVYTAVQLTGAEAPTDFTTAYYKMTGVNTFEQCVAGDYTNGGYFYTKYNDRNHTYAVKIIKVQ